MGAQDAAMNWVDDAKAVDDSRKEKKINQKGQGQMGSQEAYEEGRHMRGQCWQIS